MYTALASILHETEAPIEVKLVNGKSIEPTLDRADQAAGAMAKGEFKLRDGLRPFFEH